MKRLISLLFSGMLAISSVIGQESQSEIFKKLGIPERFVGYEKNRTGKALIIYGENAFELVQYDANADGKDDVLETYAINISQDGLSYYPNEHPYSYGFDINGDGEVTENESFKDMIQDGLNGNEEPMYK